MLSPDKGIVDFSREETDMRSMEDEGPANDMSGDKKKKKKKKDKKEKKDKREKREKSNLRVGEVYDESMSRSAQDVMAFDSKSADN